MAHRTTLTLQDDVYEALVRESRSTGRRLRDVVNEAIRQGLAAGAQTSDVELGTFSSKVLLDLTSTSGALDMLEEADHR